MQARILHTRLIALVAGIALCVAAIAGLLAALPPQGHADASKEYGYVYSGAKSSSVPFVESASTDETLYVFGSSEFSTPESIVPEVPAGVFGRNDYGLQPMLLGEAYDQSLWHAIALGAYARGDVPRNKVAIIVGPGWFTDGGMDAETFNTRFSYSLYAGFCANASIPDDVKAYVRGRLSALGVDQTAVDACSHRLAHDALNDVVFGAIDDLKLRRDLIDVRSEGIVRPDAATAGAGLPQATAQAQEAASTGAAASAGSSQAETTDSPQAQEASQEAAEPSRHQQPDFEQLKEQALRNGDAISTTNDWGVEDGFYTKRLAPVLDEARDSRTGETYSQTPEYDDLDCFLDIARACNLEALVILSPVMGPYYDHIGVSADTRASCYERIRAVVAEHDNAQLADYSDHEYEKHFLYDIVHFGTLGWACVDESLYRFALEE